MLPMFLKSFDVSSIVILQIIRMITICYKPKRMIPIWTKFCVGTLFPLYTKLHSNREWDEAPPTVLYPPPLQDTFVFSGSYKDVL